MPTPRQPAGEYPAPTGARPEIVYAVVDDGPLGPLLLAATDRGLVRAAYVHDGAGPEPVLADLADRVSPWLIERPAGLERVRRELDEYFAGRRRRFAFPLDWRLATGFRRRALDATATIGYGCVATYGEVACLAGRPGAARAVGGAVGANPLAVVVPCHRVVAAGGIGGYGAGVERKRFLLELEGALAPQLGSGGAW